MQPGTLLSRIAGKETDADTLAERVISRPALVAELERLAGTPRRVLEDAKLMELFLPTLRADLRMSETYRAEGALELPIVAFGGREDDEVAPERLLAWEEETAATFESRWFAGGHFYLAEREGEVLRALDERLAATL